MATNNRGNSGRKTTARSTSSSKTRSARTRNVQEEELDYSLRSELVIIGMVALTVFLFLCNFGICGAFGNAVSSVLFGLFGFTAYVAPLVALLSVAVGVANFGSSASKRKIISGLVIFFIVGMVAELLSGRPQAASSYDIGGIFAGASTQRNGGGIFAGSLAYFSYKLLSLVGTVLVLLVAGIVAIVVFTQHSFVGGLKMGGIRLLEKTREEADNYRDYAERRREKMEQRRAEIERERQLAIEQKEDEKILRMEKKVSGVMIDTALDKEKEAEAVSDELSEMRDEKKNDRNLFIPDEDEFHDDIHEITLKDEADRAIRAIEGAESYEEESDKEYEEEPGYGSDLEVRAHAIVNPEPDARIQTLRDPGVVRKSVSRYEDEPGYEMGPRSNEAAPSEYATDIESDPSYDHDAEREYEPEYQDEPIPDEEPEHGSVQDYEPAPVPSPSSDGRDTSLQRLVARATDEFEDEDILPDVPVHAEHLGNGMNGDYVIHAQDHISRSTSGSTAINGAAPAISSTPGPHTTSPGMEKAIEQHKKAVPKKYIFPPLDLLEKGKKNKNNDSERTLKETAVKLQETLKTFGVNVTVTDISQGPAVTRFELQPEAGVRVNKIVGLSDDIKMNLAASDIRIEAPIPGKAAVGIEVPNKENQAVALRDLFESDEYQNFSSRLAFAVGKDIAGKTVVTDIAKMPHLLIAGATGSGKSVCINTIIMSLIYKSDPKDVQMIMIDPKIVELSVYNGIPHLMIPVVTDPKKAAAALNWAVAEMTNRYKKFAETGVRDLKGYNKMLIEKNDPDQPPLPQLVVIVDELADLMMVSAKEVEDSICRLTQLARAAGIHLIIATQRPSVDVITGLIKANMPSRIAFAVSSGVDSRTILDITGAEKLLGKGDMLFYPQGYTKPARVQGAFVSDKEVQAVTDFLRNQGIDSSYGANIEEQINSMQGQSGGDAGASSGGDSGSDMDEYFVQAGNIIIESQKASIGMLQRKFKIGFNRAARIMDQLCEAGVVGDEEGTKPRKVLMTKAEFDELLGGGE
ncbi:MAG: DNA translocase FtsK [Butyrivibrio sp.]|nr:DNA translocase FtsK [Butyrivibrio sp.]